MHPEPLASQAGWPGFLALLSGRSVVVSIMLGVLAAAALNPIFITPFPVLLGRTLFLSMVMLLVHTAARQWSLGRLPRWLPAWLPPLLAVGAAAPVATLAVYLLAVGGELGAVFGVPERISGFLWIAGTGLVLGLLVSAGAMVRERLSLARTQALQFELERSRLERQALDARLAVLQAQIEPHFLFNTLANVQALVESGSPRAAGVLKSLIAYLRAAMPRLHDAEPTLGNELALVQAYLELMQMRMPDRLQFSLDVPASLHGRRFPAMGLLTLVENAVRHGIDPSENGGHIEIGAAVAEQAGGWRLWVADSGRGLQDSAGGGTGLANLRARLKGFFGAGAELQLSEVLPQGLRAELLLPASEGSA